MPNLIIRKRIDLLTFGTWKWSKSDFECPLTFQLDGAQAQIFIERDAFQVQSGDLHISMRLQFVLIIDGAPSVCISALRSRGDKSKKFAQRIYDYYIENLVRFEGILRDAGKLRNLKNMGVLTIHNFY